jgi:hypothetical protein
MEVCVGRCMRSGHGGCNFFIYRLLDIPRDGMEKKECQSSHTSGGLGKGITEAKSYPRRNSAERRLRTQDLVTRRASTHHLHQACTRDGMEMNRKIERIRERDMA